MGKNVETLDAILRKDLLAFTRKTFETVIPGEQLLLNWHHEAIAWRLQQCLNGDITRLIVTLPPRNLKSICTSVAFPAWILGRDPTRNVICVSYSDDLARFFSRQRRRTMETAWYRKAFPKARISKTKNTETELVTTQGGGCLTTSIGGTLTGRGANFLIIDDPIKAGEAMSEAERKKVNDWFRNVAYTRLNDKAKDVIVIVMQRVHMDDLASYVQDLDDWTILNLPAIATEYEEIIVSDTHSVERFPGDVLHPARESLETLEQIKRAIGSYAFAAQYQQTPVPPGGNMIKRDWFKRYGKPPSLDRFPQIVQSWDTAIETGDSSSYSVCTTWGIFEERFYLLDVLRARLEFPALKKCVVRHAENWNANPILIEKAASGITLIQTLRSHSQLNLIAITPKFDKETRAAEASATIEAGRMFLPQEAAWLAEFENELLSFPYSKHDDQVDSMTQFIRWATTYGRRQLEFKVTVLRGGGDRNLYRERMGGWSI